MILVCDILNFSPFKLGLLTTLVVTTCLCRKMSCDTTAFDMSSDIFKNFDNNVDVENVEIFKRAKFKHLSTKNSFVAQGLFICYKLLIFKHYIVKRHIFYDTCVMYLIYDEIE